MKGSFTVRHMDGARRLIDCPSLRVWKNELFGVDAQIIAGGARYAKLPSNRRPMRPKKEEDKKRKRGSGSGT